jgi:single-strand DNA-binding protein
MNKLFIKGNLTRDPEIKDINGKKLCKFSVACTTRVRAGQGEFKDETVYLDVAVWEKQAERCSFLRRGSGVFITGRLKEEVWKDKTTQEEKKKYVMHPESIDFIAKDLQRGENVGQIPVLEEAPVRKPAPKPRPTSYDDQELPY